MISFSKEKKKPEKFCITFKKYKKNNLSSDHWIVLISPTLFSLPCKQDSVVGNPVHFRQCTVLTGTASGLSMACLTLTHPSLLGPGAHKDLFSPVLCKFWQLYGGVTGDLLLQEG